MENNTNISQDVEQDHLDQTQPTNPVGTEGSSPQAVTPPAADNQVGGPNQIAAETRRKAEAYNRLQSDPTFAEFQEFKKKQEEAKLAEEAQKNQVSPEVWNRLTSMERMIQEQTMQREYAEAQRSFQSFAEKEGMPHAVQTEFLEWLERELDPDDVVKAAKPGFKYHLFIDAFAKHKGLLGAAPKPNAPVYVPGHGTGAGQGTAQDEQLKAHIKNRVKGY